MDWEQQDQDGTRGAAAGSAGGLGVQPPLAIREPVEHVIHGDRRVDHYEWMRHREDPRVKEYLDAENAYADAVLRPTEGFQEKVYQEMLGRIQQTDLSVPYSLRGYWYYTRTEEGKQYPIYCRKKAISEGRRSTGEEERSLHSEPARNAGSPVGMTGSGEADEGSEAGTTSLAVPDEHEHGEGPEEVLLDLNELAVGHSYMGLGIFEVSDDNRFLAYATDTTGYRQYVLEVKDLAVASGEWRVASSEWLEKKADPSLE